MICVDMRSVRLSLDASFQAGIYTLLSGWNECERLF